MDAKLSRWCDGVIEAGWLLAVILAPIFFNVHSDRVFEPDKITFVRSLAVVMALAWLVKFAAQQGWRDLAWLRWRGERSIWRMPFTLPVTGVALAYLISSIFSIAPYVSWAGSYQRLQGTYSTFSYIVIFALIAATIRTRAQLRRLVTTVIVTSLPVALYGLLQWRQVDPLPWGGDTTTRVAGHMGNSIFVGAYLILAFPITVVRIVEAFSAILTEEKLAYADVTRATIYIFTAAIQLFTLFRTQSRGPALGLAVGLFALVLILLVGLRNVGATQGGRRASSWLWPLAMIGLAALGLVLSAFLRPTLGALGSFAVFAGVLAALGLAIMILAAARRGQRWLWASWIGLALFAGVVLVLFNVAANSAESTPSPLTPIVQTLDAWRELPVIGRLGSLLEDNEKTGKVRVLIWSGALELIKPHAPIRYPDGKSDRFNFLRPLFGYGPEAMYVAYNSFYPPELATVEARNASPDRSHNETFDALVITGVVGFVAWQVLYLSMFTYGFRWLGILRTRRETWLLIFLWVTGAAVALAFFVWWKGWVYLGVAIPFGSIFLGLMLYLVYYALFGSGRGQAAEAHALPAEDRLLLVGLLAALTAFYVEVHFGIAIASTRVHSFVYLGLVFIIGYWLPRHSAETAIAPTPAPASPSRGSRRAPTPAPAHTLPLGALVTVALILSVIVGVLFYEYITYTPQPGELEGITDITQLPTAVDIFHRALLVNPLQDFVESPYIYGMGLLTWLLGLGLFFSEMIKQGALIPGGSNLTARRAQGVMGLLLFIGVAGLIGGVVTFNGADSSLSARLGGAVLSLWAVIALVNAGWLWRQPQSAGCLSLARWLTAVGALMALATLAGGALLVGALGLLLNGALIYALWDRQTVGPFVIVGVTAFVLALVFALAQASLFRNSFITPPEAQNLTIPERRVLEAEQVAAYLPLAYLFVLGICLATGASLAAERENQAWPWRSALAWLTWPVLLVLLWLTAWLNDLRAAQAVAALYFAVMLVGMAGLATTPYRKTERWRMLVMWGATGLLVLLLFLALVIPDSTGLLTITGLGMLAYAVAWALYLTAEAEGQTTPGHRAWVWALVPVALVLGLLVIRQTNLRVVQADMIYKRAKPFDSEALRLARQAADSTLATDAREQARQGSVAARDNAIAIYEQAIRMVPREDFYYLWLGRAYLEKTTVLPRTEVDALLTAAQERLLEAQSINPLNTDHTANLARLNVRWAGLLAQDNPVRQKHIDDAVRFYQDAMALSPYNSIIRNEYGGLLLTLAKRCDDAIAVLEESNRIDPFYTGTTFSLADAYVVCAPEDDVNKANSNLAQATQMANEALTRPTDKGQTRAEVRLNVARLHLVVGNRYLQMKEYDLARDSAENALATQTDNPTILAQIQAFQAQITAAENG